MIRISRRSFIKSLIVAAGLYMIAGSLDGYDDVEVVGLDLNLGKSVVFLPDIHVHSVGERDYVVDLVRRLNPDILILGGDTWDPRTRGLKVIGDLMSKLKAYSRHNVIVLGNHEYNADASRRIPLKDALSLAEDTGYIVLRDDKITLEGLIVAGVDWRSDPRDYADVARMIGEADILVSHSPDVFPHATSQQSLVLAGHTHGGQMCLPGSRSILTNSKYGYTWGLYTQGTRAMYVSRGLGEMIPPRIFCRRQAVKIA